MNTPQAKTGVEVERLIGEALAAGPTKGDWRRAAMGGGSTVLTETMPGRNDTRIPAYGYKSENGYCIGYPFLEDDGGTRLDFICMSHADAEYIAAVQPANIRQLLASLAAERAEAVRMREAAMAVLAHREGDLPTRGWLRDNDASRKALFELAAALSPSQQGEPK